MKTLLNRTTIIIASIALLIAITAIVSVNVFNSTGPVTGLAATISRPLRALTSTVARTFAGIYDSIYRYDDLMAKYESMLIQQTERERDYAESKELAEENAQLRALLGFRERHTGYDHEDARVGNRGGSNWSSSFTINRGHANSGVSRGNAVVTEYGVLIGQVTTVGARSSTVVTILDTTFSAGAFIGDSGGQATVRGDFELMRSGLLMLDHIDEDQIILPGDSIVTSGIGSVFPSGLFVGEVVEVLRHNTGVGRYATVRPLLGIEAMSQVFVITGFEITEQ